MGLKLCRIGWVSLEILGYLQVNGIEGRGNNVPVTNPFVALNHDQATPKHGVSVSSKHTWFSPSLRHHHRRHFLQELWLCNVQEWLRPQPVHENFTYTKKNKNLRGVFAGKQNKQTKNCNDIWHSRLTMWFLPARKVWENVRVYIMSEIWGCNWNVILFFHLVNVSKRKTWDWSSQPTFLKLVKRLVRENPPRKC